MKNDSVRLNLTVKKESYEIFKSVADEVNLRYGAFFDVLMRMLATSSDDPEKIVGKFVLEVLKRQTK